MHWCLFDIKTWTVPVEHFPAWWDVTTSHQGNRQSCNTQPCSKCSVTCGCPHPLLSPGTQWWTGWLWELCKVTSCLLLSYMYLHFTVLYAFVLLQQKGKQTCGFREYWYMSIIHFNVHNGDGTARHVFLLPGHTADMLKCMWHCWMWSHTYINFTSAFQFTRFCIWAQLQRRHLGSGFTWMVSCSSISSFVLRSFFLTSPVCSPTVPCFVIWLAQDLHSF